MHLPKADLVSDDLVFTGGGEECEMFIVAVKKQAFKAGKATDSAWAAQFAGTCFAGAALRWYEALDDATQSDWGLLRRALLARYPPSMSELRNTRLEVLVTGVDYSSDATQSGCCATGGCTSPFTVAKYLGTKFKLSRKSRKN